ncbi:MAG: hypothetical protein PWQ14_1187 [Rikenellaceae bacterium]|nr:hypothetical protein [Rikenellaceae bacterium]
MAKDIIFRAKLDTKQAEANARNLGQNINKSVSETTGVDKLSQRMAELNKNIDEGNLSIRQYRIAIREYQQIAQEAGLQSPIGKEALERAAKLKDTYSDLQMQVQQLSQDHRKMNLTMQGVNVAVNSYQAFTGVMGLLGGESEKYLQIMSKMMIVQQSYNAILQITQAFEKQTLLGYYARIAATKVLTGVTAAYNAVVGTSTGVMKAFRVALASTGIGLIVVALGLLISNFDKVIEVVKKVIGWLGDFGKAVGNLFGAIFKSNKDLEKSNEDVEKSERKLAREHKKALRERERESRRVNRELKKIQKEYTDSLKENEEEYEKELLKLTLSNASTIEKNNALMDKLNKDYEAKINYLFAIQQKFVDESGKWTNKVAEMTFQNLRIEAEKTQAQIDALQKTNAEIEKSEADRLKAEEDAAERRREAAQREKERLQKLAEDYDNFTKQINETIKSSNEAIEEMNLQKELSDLDTFSRIEKMRNVDLMGVEEWYLEQLNFLETYKNDKARYNAALIELEQARVNKQAEINVKYDLELLAAREKFEENYKKFIEEKEKEKAQIYLQSLKARGENELYINESYRLKEQEIRQNYEELLKEAEAAMDSERLATLQAMLQAELDMLAANKEAEIQMNLEAEKKMAEDSLKIKRDSMREQSFIMIDALSQIFNNMSQLSEKNARQQKTFAYISLALSQAKAMGEAIYGAMKMMNELPADPISKIAFFVGTLATFMGIITSTIMQAKQIANSGNIGIGGGINPALTNNVNQNYNAVQENRATEPPPQQVYVLESDITSTQNRIRRINVNQVL